MSEAALKTVTSGDLSIKVPEIWNAHTETYTEPDGRECSMIEISAVEGDPRSIIISYGPMPEGSDAIMEAGDTYEEVVGEIGPEVEDDPICEYDFLGTQVMASRFLQKTDLHAISSAQRSDQNQKDEATSSLS